MQLYYLIKDNYDELEPLHILPVFEDDEELDIFWDSLDYLDYDCAKARDIEQFIKKYKKMIEKNKKVPLIVSGLSLSSKGVNIKKKNTENSSFTGWEYFYKNVFKEVPRNEWRNGKWKNRINIIIYSKDAKLLKDYISDKKSNQEKLVYRILKRNKYIISSNETGSHKILQKTIKRADKHICKIPKIK